MFKITVKKGAYIVAVYYNRDAASGEWQARAKHGGRCEYRIEEVDTAA